jgi:hypothetical protein
MATPKYSNTSRRAEHVSYITAAGDVREEGRERDRDKGKGEEGGGWRVEGGRRKEGGGWSGEEGGGRRREEQIPSPTWRATSSSRLP